MSILSKLFGGGSKSREPEPELYNDYRIYPAPEKESAGYRIGARIEKEIGGEVKVHHMIRSDTYGSEDIALEASVTKARQVIDQLGDTIFG